MACTLESPGRFQFPANLCALEKHFMGLNRARAHLEIINFYSFSRCINSDRIFVIISTRNSSLSSFYAFFFRGLFASRSGINLINLFFTCPPAPAELFVFAFTALIKV